VRKSSNVICASVWLRSSRILYYSHTVGERLILAVVVAAKEEKQKAKLFLNGGGEWRGAIVAPLISCRNPYLKRLPAPLLSRSPLSVMRFLSFCVRAGYLRRRYVPCTLLLFI
jgi:hypothetical protein